MFLKVCKIVTLLVCLGMISTAAAKQPVTLDGSSLPLRVLSKPFASIYKANNPTQSVFQDNIPAFQSYYVYTKPVLGQPNAMYEVGSDANGTIVGWMKADDVFEWKQAMCLAYTHPQGRQPVMMFEDQEYLADLASLDPADRTAMLDKLYGNVVSKNIPANFPIKSIEPARYVDISKEFYLLPILDFENIMLESDDEMREGRLLKLAAVTKASGTARESSDIRTNTAFVEQATQTSAQVAANMLGNVAIDLVFVMDTSMSMGPYIQSTLDVVKTVSNRLLQDPKNASRIKFGVWGYRDAVSANPALEYVVKNYTPVLQDHASFVQTLSTVKATTADSGDYPEDMFSGVSAALDNTGWTNGAMRIIILVGDAPAHEAGHPKNSSGKNAQVLRALADQNKVYLMALHLKDPRATRFHDISYSQLSMLATNKGVTSSAYYAVPTGDQVGYAKATTVIANSLVKLITAPVSSHGELADLLSNSGELAALGAAGELGALGATNSTPQAVAPPVPSPAGATGELAALGTTVPADQKTAELNSKVQGVINAALVEWVGTVSGAQAPSDIEAWVVDKDLKDISIQSLDVRILLSKKQLDTLTVLLESLVAAGQSQRLGAGDFFTSLQATVAATARNPEQIKNAANLSESGLVPEFLMGLPYNSVVMSMNNELWESMAPDAQDDFINGIEAKIKAYKSIHDNSDGWIALNSGASPDEMVYPISLELLP